MYLKPNLQRHISQYAVAAFNTITAITTLTQHLNSNHMNKL